jgi:hypothetical protein
MAETEYGLTLSGALTVAPGATANFTGATVVGLSATTLQSVNVDATNYQDYGGNTWLSIATGFNPTLAQTLLAGGHSIQNLAAPVNPNDAATKTYVDTGKYVYSFGGNLTATAQFLQANGIAGSAVVNGVTSVPNSQLDAVMPSGLTISKVSFITSTGDATTQFSIYKNATVVSTFTCVNILAGVQTLGTTVTCVQGDYIRVAFVAGTVPGSTRITLYIS